MEEIWKEIPNLDGKYLISTKGRIMSIRPFSRVSKYKILKVYISPKYLTAYLCKRQKQFTQRVHRLVAQAFIPNPNNYPLVCHIDGNRLNNSVENLYWGTHLMNEADKQRMGTTARGERNGVSKLKNHEVLKIRSLYLSKNYTQTQLGKAFKVTPYTVNQIVNNKTWVHLQ